MYKNKSEDGTNNLCGEKVKQYRLAMPKKTSQRKLADLLQVEGLDLDKNAIQRIEAGKRFVTDIELITLSKVLNKSFDELLVEAENGIYVTELKSFSAANAVTGDFSIESGGFMIENGKLGKFVKSFTIAGNFFELLKNIEALSDDLQVKPSGLFRGYAAPDALVKNISVAGK